MHIVEIQSASSSEEYSRSISCPEDDFGVDVTTKSDDDDDDDQDDGGKRFRHVAKRIEI